MTFLEFLIISPILTLVTCQVNNTVTNSIASTTPLHAPANNVLVLSTFDPNNKPLTVNFDGKSEMNHMVLPFEIFQGLSMTIWISNIEMALQLMKDVD